MKVRESGMPEEDMWKGFFRPANILKTMGVAGTVAEFGCGYGTFTIPTAKMISGKIYALDIEPEMMGITQRKAGDNRLRNVETVLRDFMTDGTGLNNGSVDYVMLFNILHVDDPDILLKEAYRILKPRGKVGIIHWNYDPTTPRGPPMKIRPKPEQCMEWAEHSGFSNLTRYDLKPYHYGIVGVKE